MVGIMIILQHFLLVMRVIGVCIGACISAIGVTMYISGEACLVVKQILLHLEVLLMVDSRKMSLLSCLDLIGCEVDWATGLFLRPQAMVIL